MRDKDYSEIIFDGLEHHRNYFEQYITRCIKKADKDFITNIEFLSRLADVMKRYETELLKCWIAKQEDFNNNLTIENVQNKINELNNSITFENVKNKLIEGFPTLENIFFEIGSYTNTYNGKFGFAEIALIRETILSIAQQLTINIDVSQTTISEYENKTKTQKIAWLHEIGVLETVMNKCKNGETINSRRAAHVIHSFTGIDAETLRKCLGAIYQPGTDQKNNPLVNPENKLFVADMAKRFKLNKENK